MPDTRPDMRQRALFATRNTTSGQLVIHLEVLHLVRDVMHATPNTESETLDIDAAVLRVR